MAGLSRSVLQARPDVFRLQIRIILKNFLLGQACSQQIEYVLDANAHTADTRPAPTLLRIESNSVEVGHVKCAHWSMNQSANLFQRLQQQQPRCVVISLITLGKITARTLSPPCRSMPKTRIRLQTRPRGGPVK